MLDLDELEKKLGICRALATIDPIQHPKLDDYPLQLFIKREDRLHPVLSGNKWRKLKYILKHALDLGYDHLISMGGPYSNHLHALAWIGKQLDIKTTGLIRGEAPTNESKTLRDLRDWGMTMHFMTRSEFRHLRQYHSHDSPPAGQFRGYWIAEGGATTLAMQGIAEMMQEINQPFDLMTLACGTGTTLAGIARSLPTKTQAMGFAVLKGASYLDHDVRRLTGSSNWTINHDYHFGGFARGNDTLKAFVHDFEKHTGIPIEPVYTGKMVYGLFDLIKNNTFMPGQKIIVIHTGGLQGKR